MPGTSNPFTTPYANRDAAALLAAEKQYVRKTIADADAIRNGDWAGQFAGLHLLSNGADYDINTVDTTTADNGDSQIRDANNILFSKVTVVILPVPKLITASGDVTIADTETADEIEINNTSSSAISVFMPSAAVRTKAITVTDVGGNANTYNITVKPKATSGQTIMTGSQYVIDSNGGGIKLTPNSAKTGYK